MLHRTVGALSLALLPTLAANAAPIPRGQPLAPDELFIDLTATGAFPNGIPLGGAIYDTAIIDPRGVLTLDRALPRAMPPAPLAAVDGIDLIAPLWSLLDEACPPGAIELAADLDSLAITWIAAPIAGCRDGEATFALLLAPGDAGGLRVTFFYEALPPSDPRAQPRAGVTIGDGALELLPDGAQAPSDRGKALLEGSSDGVRGEWVIVLDGDGLLVGDPDRDGVRSVDNCERDFNPLQVNTDDDELGDTCDLDDDDDDVPDPRDNCPIDHNPGQPDLDADGIGDACDSDRDGDGLLDVDDHCPIVPDSARLDRDGDGIGDACDRDIDGDGLFPLGTFPATKLRFDRCPYMAEAISRDGDGDGIGDACDQNPARACQVFGCHSERDSDGDRIPDLFDRCPTVPDPFQSDRDRDDIGDACDPDADGDGVLDLYQGCVGCIRGDLPRIIGPMPRAGDE